MISYWPSPSRSPENGTALFLPVTVDAPRVIYFITLGRKRLHQADVLIEPIAFWIGRMAVIIAAVLHKNADRLHFAIGHQFRENVATPDIGETSCNRDELAEIIRPEPCDAERRDRP